MLASAVRPLPAKTALSSLAAGRKILGLIALLGLAVSTQATASDTLLIDCGALIDGHQDSVQRSQRLQIEAGRIGAITALTGSADPASAAAQAAAAQTTAAQAAGRYLDLRDYTCLPGLLDLHTHLTDLPQNTADFRIYPRRSAADHLALARDNAAAPKGQFAEKLTLAMVRFAHSGSLSANAKYDAGYVGPRQTSED